MSTELGTIITTAYNTPVGKLRIGVYDGRLCMCDWSDRINRKSIDDRLSKDLNANFRPGQSDLADQTIHQLNQYFDGERTSFDLPLRMVGTTFQKTVWKMLSEIPYGTTMSYRDLSVKMNNIRAIRAVASANGANPLSIVIPCHRVIGSDGSLVGYAGGKRAKQILLELEGAIVADQLSLFK